MTSIKNSHKNIQDLLVGTWDNTKVSMLALGLKKFLLSFLLMKNEIETWAALQPGLCVHAMKSCHQQSQWASYHLFLKKTWQHPTAMAFMYHILPRRHMVHEGHGSRVALCFLILQKALLAWVACNRATSKAKNCLPKKSKYRETPASGTKYNQQEPMAFKGHM